MAQRTLQKRAGRTVRASEDGRYQGNKASPAQQDWLMHRHSEMWQHSMHKACASLSQGESESCEGKQTQAPILAPKAISSWWSVSPKGEIILWWRLTGDTNHTNGQAPCPAIEGQHKTTPIVVLEIFVCVWASIAFPCTSFTHMVLFSVGFLSANRGAAASVRALLLSVLSYFDLFLTYFIFHYYNFRFLFIWERERVWT